MNYRLADPYIDQEQLDLVNEILLSKKLVHGEYCEQFEKELAHYLGIGMGHVAVTSSCTASLHLALIALGIEGGEGVLVPDFTFPATANVVERVGATPLFVDVDPLTYTMKPGNLEAAIGYWRDKIKLRAIIVVHEFGAVAEQEHIVRIAKENGLLVIEDAACAFGSKVDQKYAGLMSDVGCFSFHPRKALTTGEGGAVVSQNPEIIERIKVLRNHGMKLTDHGIDFVEPGLNYRLTNFQAALGLVQLRLFDEWIEQRRLLQSYYRELITTDLVTHPQDQEGHSWQSYMVVLAEGLDRTRIIQELKAQGIETNFGANHVLGTAYYQKKYGESYPEGMPVSERLYSQGLCLPLHQGMGRTAIVEVADAFNTLLERYYGD